MQDTLKAITPTDLREALSSEHRKLEKEMRSILECVHCGDTNEMRERWEVFANALRAHLDEEERDILPLFEQREPATCAKIREEHARIRAGLEERAVEIELHTVRENKTAEFIEMLRRHAAREESTLYVWANRARAEGKLEQMGQRLATRMQAV